MRMSRREMRVFPGLLVLALLSCAVPRVYGATNDPNSAQDMNDLKWDMAKAFTFVCE
jgi:hypothetical protein